MTASRALANPGIVSDKTRQRVEAAVAETGYVPNFIAGAMRSRRTRLVACLVPNIGSGSVFMDAVQTLTEAFGRAGYQVILGQRGYELSQEERLIEAVLARRPDAIVLMGAVRSQAARDRLQAAAVPVVETWDMTSRPVDMLVGFSHRALGAAVARFLVERGRRRFAVFVSDEPRGAARARGFVEGLRRLGAVPAGQAVPTFRFRTPSRMHHGRQGLATLLAGHPDIDAVFCANDLVALGALLEARARAIDVPGRLALVGFGDADFATDTDPPLTTVRVDSALIGERAAGLVIARLDAAESGGRRGAGPGPGRARADEAGTVFDVGFRIVPRGTA